MKITKEMLLAWGAYQSIHDMFLDKFPDGEGEYQDILDTLVENDRPIYANWLMDCAGSDEEAVFETETLTGKHFFFAGHIIAKAGISLTGFLRAGNSIEAGGDIKSGYSIKAGDSIKSGGNIKAAGSIKAGDGIKSGGIIKAGNCIEAGGSIKAAGSIKAGDGIRAGSIKAGDGIRAGNYVEALHD